MLVNTVAALQRLIDNEVPEGPSLEYKSALPLSSKKQRVELLKDITGMGNGGGGTLVYGIAERSNAEGIPDSIIPLADRGVVGAVEDLVRTGIRPPLLMDLAVVDVEGGFVLTIDVQRSLLGPYMIQVFDQMRYYRRVGSRTVPMDEQEVRDGYAFATRTAELHADLWDRHGLPIPVFDDAPWLSIAAVPRAPAGEIFDPKDFPNPVRQLGSGEIPSFVPAAGRTRVADFDNQLAIWAGGLHAELAQRNQPPHGFLRIHRDGSVGIAEQIDAVTTWEVVDYVNVYLLRVGLLWRVAGLRGPVEVRVDLRNMERLSLFEDPMQSRSAKTVVQPPHAPDPEVALRLEVMAEALIAPARRHAIVRQFSDRLQQAFGSPGDNGDLFEWGWLYRPGDDSLRLSLDRAGLWDADGREVAVIDVVGCVWNNAGILVGHAREGLVTDGTGDALCATEMCTNPGLPDDFYPGGRWMGAVGSGIITPPRAPRPGSVSPPEPTRQWSAGHITTLLRQLDS